MINENQDKKEELDQILDAAEKGEPIYKTEADEPSEDSSKIGELSNSADDSEFKDTPQDLKDTTSQE